RKQYLYHRAWREAQDRLKFDRMLPFGQALPNLRRTVRRDLSRDGFPFRRVAGAAIRLLDIAAIRVGNDRYAVSNGSFGLTTLRTKHVQHDGPSVVFEFEAKGGKQTRVTIGDQGLVRVLRELDGVPGYRVFQYADDGGAKRDLTSEDVNRYLAEAASSEFSAKDFRTWAGNARAVDLLVRARYPTSADVRSQRIRETLQDVASHLGNTPAVARSSYVDPRLLELYEGGGFAEFKRRAKARVPELARPGRRKRECLLIALLEAL
ncbi:MAG: DNA topoisomerase IB, partial [Longimicrobiales bacterium]